MSELVDPSLIEGIVGVERHDHLHFARAVTEEETVYILHSRNCLQTTEDLRDCSLSIAMSNGINLDRWRGYEDTPVNVCIDHDGLVPKYLA